jgi:hypothetical protein
MRFFNDDDTNDGEFDDVVDDHYEAVVAFDGACRDADIGVDDDVYGFSYP